MRATARIVLAALGMTALVVNAVDAQQAAGSLRLPVRADSRLWL